MKEFIVLMALLMSIVAISIDAMLPALGVIGQDLGVTNPNTTQLIVSCIFGGMVIGQLVCGPLSDSVGRKKVLYAGLGLYFAGSIVCYLSQSIEIMLLGRFIQGIGVSGPYVSVVAIVRDRYAGRDMARVMSLVMMIFILVPAIAPLIGQGIMAISSWRMIYLFFIVFSSAIAIWVHFRLPETLHPEDKIKFSFHDILRGFKTVFGNRVTVSYMLCMGICFGSLIGYLNSSRQIFQEIFHAGSAFPFYFGGLALIIGVASMINSRFVQKFGMHVICRRAVSAIIVASLCFLILHVFIPITVWIFVAYAAVFYFAFGLMFGNLNAIAMEPMGHVAGIASAVTGATSSLISLLLGTTIGQMYDGTLIPISAGFFVLGCVTLGLMHVADRVK